MSEKRRFRVTIEGPLGSASNTPPEAGMRADLYFLNADVVVGGHLPMLDGASRIVAVEELPPPLSDKERADRAEAALREARAWLTKHALYSGAFEGILADHGIDLSEPPG